MKEIHSDNGTNFTASERELRRSICVWNQERIHESLLQKDIKWTFNPPYSSHHGGVWERCIRTTRKILNPLLKQQTLDDEVLVTLMCEVESIINGRPITRVSEDAKDLEPLTPNHLLLLKSGSVLPRGTFRKKDIFSCRRWRQVQYMADQFWRRWSKEYLPLLQQRQKWHYPRRNIEDDTSPRNCWPMASVVEAVPGRDGRVRRVKLKTRTSLLDQPIDKCVLLQATEESSTH